jgi:hypothetical protein
MDQAAIVAAVNDHQAKLRLERIERALQTLRAQNTLQSIDLQAKERHLQDLQNAQQLLRRNAQVCMFATSRRDATPAGGFPDWQTYMDRILFYRKLGSTDSLVCRSWWTFAIS